MYTVIIKFYDELSSEEDKITTSYCFVPADSFNEVVDIMQQYYGKANIVEITVSDFSSECFLEFTEDLADMFYTIKDTLTLHTNSGEL